MKVGKKLGKKKVIKAPYKRVFGSRLGSLQRIPQDFFASRELHFPNLQVGKNALHGKKLERTKDNLEMYEKFGNHHWKTFFECLNIPSHSKRPA